jgi:hypothetical protein
MSTCPIAYGTGKDSNANFVEQLRNASDVTAMIRRRGIKRNYTVGSTSLGKNIDPIGGIPQSDLLALAHTVMSTGPSNALTPRAGYSIACSPCVNLSYAPFSTLQASLSLIRY